MLEDAVTKRFARSDAVHEVFERRVPARMTYLLIAANLLVFAYGYQLSQSRWLSGKEYLGAGSVSRVIALIIEWRLCMRRKGGFGRPRA